MNKKILFITWDGPETNYLEALFLPIFEELRARGWDFHVLQFRWGSSSGFHSTKMASESAGIPYRAVRVARWPRAAGAFVTAVLGWFHVIRAVRGWGIEVLMPRALMPALASRPYWGSKRLAMVFDSDGLEADLRVESAGLSPHSFAYRLLRDVEQQICRHADVVLTRTRRGAEILSVRDSSPPGSRKYAVVANGRRLPSDALSQARDTTNNSPVEQLKMCYVGSIGRQYLTENMILVACEIQRHMPSATFKIITPNPAEARRMVDRICPLGSDWITILQVSASGVFSEIVGCNLGLAFRQASFSQQAVSPLKIGDYLMAGIPILGSPIGDEAQHLVNDGVFFSTQAGDIGEITTWISDVIGKSAVAIRQKARQHWKANFSLQTSVADYERALGPLMFPV